MKSKIGRGSGDGFCGEAIKNVSGVTKSFYRKVRRQTSLK
jgi:hypothetical protein